jgi:hypothetical protein
MEGKIMNARLLKNLKYAAAFPVFMSAFVVTPVLAAQIEALLLSRPPASTIPASGGTPRTIQRKFLKFDEKGDLLIRCGCARITAAYTEPADQFKPSGQQQFRQREHNTIINGISLTASLSF